MTLIDEAGWNAVMDGLASATSIMSLNGVNGLEQLFAGTATEAILSSKELQKREVTVAVSRLLFRNRKTLTTLDLRWCPCHHKN